MDEERLLQPTAENLAFVKVFPLIPSLKKDIVVSVIFEDWLAPVHFAGFGRAMSVCPCILED